MLKISSWPVLVFGAPRTGTTMLTEWLARDNACKRVFFEPDLDPFRWAEFCNIRSTSAPYMVKLQGHRIHQARDLVGTRILVHRQDIVAQVASHYLAYTRRKWYYRAGESSLDPVTIDSAVIDRSVRIVNEERSWCSAEKWDVAVAYEYLLAHAPEGIASQVTPKPSNYSDLLAAVSERLNTQVSLDSVDVSL